MVSLCRKTAQLYENAAYAAVYWQYIKTDIDALYIDLYIYI